MDNNAQPTEVDNKPTNEEILESVKNQNKRGDEYEKKALITARSIGFSVALILASIITIVCVIIDKSEITYIMWFIVFGSQGTANIYYSTKVERKRKLFLSAGILQLIVAPVMFASWILTLCGII